MSPDRPPSTTHILPVRQRLAARPEAGAHSAAGHTADWWSHPVLLQRYVQSLLRGEMATLRPGGWRWPASKWEPLLHLERDLGADSLELMSLAAALGTAVELPDAEGVEALHSSPTLGAWAAVAARALEFRGDRMRYRSSGSAGLPRWHMHRLSDLMQEMRVMAEVLGQFERVVCAVPVHHIYGHLYGVLLPLCLGRPDLPFVDIQGQAPLALAQRLRPGDLVIGFPHWWQMVLAQNVQWPNHVIGLTSTAPCQASLAQGLLDQGLPRLVQVYGSTETAGVGWRDQPDAPFHLHPFWRNDRATKDQQEEDDWLVRAHALGDEGPIRAPDELEWTDHCHFTPAGRVDGVVQVGGVNVQPRAVRERLCRHPEVQDAVVRLHDFNGRPRLKAFLVPRKGIDVENLGERVREWAAAYLPAAARPVHIAVGDELPTNAMGKSCEWSISSLADDGIR